ncbi:MAG: DUF4129 domain-containing protein [Bacteroidetes bacterium]|nr:DUF4129 domain-containing protein [Bacteroidota bacterium]
MIISHSCAAQDNQRLPDSVKVDDTVSFEKKTDDETITTYNDTTAHESASEDDSVRFRGVPDSVIAAYQKDKDFEYANDSRYWVKQKAKHQKGLWDYILDWFNARWVRIFFLIVLIGLILYALFRIIADNKLYMFYSAPKKISQERIEDTDISYDDIEEKIRQAISTGDNKSTLRYMYLKALKKAGDKQLIHFHANGTNQDYINQMGNHPAAKDFRFLTNVYEYVWYGGFEPTQQQFLSLQTEFAKLYNLIDH